MLIRGGGAVNDLAWLNNYDLVRFICDLDIPVLTGIGHERDNTLPDEVAHTRFDTPSKVIASIEQHILRRVREVSAAARDTFATAARIAQHARAEIERREVQIRADANAHLSRARHGSAQTMNSVEAASVRRIHEASVRSIALLNQTRTDAARHLATAKQQVPALLNALRVRSQENVGNARGHANLAFQAVLARSGTATRTARQTADDRIQRLAERAQGAVHRARTGTEALMREVTGQGPEKTLGRGFAIVRTPEGQPVTARAHAQALATIDIQFRDGRITAQLGRKP